MKRYLKCFILMLLVTIIVISCNNKIENKPAKKEYVFTIKGSDTEFDMVNKLCAIYCNKDSLKYSVSGGGTALGVKAMINGEIEMATASREISEEEQKLLKENNIKIMQIMFATDAVAIITNPKLGVDSLTLDQVSKIYKGEISNWKEVGGPDRKITIYTRNENSGTYSYFKEKITHSEFSKSAKICKTTHKIVEFVSSDSTGIGYAGAGFLMNDQGKPSNRIWAMPISIDKEHNAYSPYQVSEVKNGNYPLTRPLYQYYKLPIKEKVKKFVLFELSHIGQTLMREFGYFSISDYQKEINKLNGYDL